MKLTYDIADKPRGGKLVAFALQQMLAILAATIAVPMIIGNGLTPAAAMFGAGVGTLVYLFFTKKKSPVFLGSSFAFLGSMAAAFAGAASMSVGFLGLIIGAVLAGLVYVIIALIVKVAGVEWINKLMPAVVIGPTVAIIGLSLAGNAIGDLQKANAGGSVYVAIICGLVTLFVTMICSVYGNKSMKLIPFIIGILAGYAVAACFTAIGNATGNASLLVVDFSPFDIFKAENIGIESFVSIPEFTFVTAFGGFGELSGAYIATVAVAYVPVAFVVFAEHIADHKNLSSIIETDLLADPGLHRTLLGDGVGSITGAFFGGCPNTTYGESVGCVAISGNASAITTLVTAVIAIIFSFIAPFTTFLATIPTCVMGGVCITLYGFIAVSGLKMLQKVNLDDNANLFPASIILILGVGGMRLVFGSITITSIAVALILGIVANVILAKGRSKAASEPKAEVPAEENKDDAN